MNKKLAAATIVAGLGIGGFAGTVFGTPGTSFAQTTGSSTTTPTATATVTAPISQADAIAALVKDGTITQAQADKVVAALKAARPEGGRGAELTVVSTALGMTPAELKTALQGGQTIAQVAASKNVAITKVTDALIADYKTKETAEVATGDHTQAEVDQKVADFTARVTDMVNGKLPAGGRGPGGRGGRGGAGANGAAPAATAAAPVVNA
jgi:hypothetical protein